MYECTVISVIFTVFIFKVVFDGSHFKNITHTCNKLFVKC